MKTLDAHKQKEYILDCGKDGEKVIERMVSAIKHGSINKVLGPFVLVIDTTKLSSVTNAPAWYMAIAGVEYPNKLIDIKGVTKKDICEILDGMSDKCGKLLAATEHTPDEVSPTEIVAAHPQSDNESNEFIKDM
eukprot:15324368-Ditylum_brightwellii.AAC.1